MTKSYLKGVVEVVNKVDAERFSKEDEKYLGEICKVLGLAFNNQGRMQRQPTKFDYLFTQQIISEDDLNQAIAKARELKTDLPSVLVNEFQVPKKALGKSFEAYYSVPFVSYEDRIIIPSALVQGLNLGYLKRNFWVPLERENGKLVILVDDPHNVERVKEIKTLMQAAEYEFQVHCGKTLSGLLIRHLVRGHKLLRSAPSSANWKASVIWVKRKKKNF